MLEDFSNKGYNVSCHKYKFEKYGVPQSRHRIVFVGFRNDLNIKFNHPKPTHKKGKFVTAKTALKKIAVDSSNHEFTKHQPVVNRAIKSHKNQENIYSIQMYLNT